jgi:hypothetical protein
VPTGAMCVADDPGRHLVFRRTIASALVWL